VGGGSDTAIAQAIYNERPLGVGMKGSISEPIIQADGSTFNVLFDNPIALPLWISFSVAALSGTFDPHYISTQLQALLKYQINQEADITSIVVLIRQIAPNVVVSAEGVSLTNSGYASTVSPTTIQNQFAVSGPNIVINGVINP
jgi:hypothetical protein